MSRNTGTTAKKKRETLSETVLRWIAIYNAPDPLARIENAIQIADEANLLMKTTEREKVIAEMRRMCSSSDVLRLLRLPELDKRIRDKAIREMKKQCNTPSYETRTPQSTGVSRTHLLHLTRAPKDNQLRLLSDSLDNSWSTERLCREIKKGQSSSAVRPKQVIAGIVADLDALTRRLDAMDESKLDTQMHLVKKIHRDDTRKQLESAIASLSALRKEFPIAMKTLTAAEKALKQL